ncbi:hypothetical protein OROGR_010723 [Orobanche gracilis]
MNRSPSELALEQLFASEDGNKIHPKADQIFEGSEFCHGFLPMENCDQITLPLKNPGHGWLQHRDYKTYYTTTSKPQSRKLWKLVKDSRFLIYWRTLQIGLEIYTPPILTFRCQLAPNRRFVTDSPSSALNSNGRDNQAIGDSSGSSQDQSEDDDLEIEAGPCEHSNNPIDVKRIKRMVSNRESARRSRRRKQAHLADLERQAEELRGQNAALFKQLADATQRFRDSTTNNRVLRSDVEALRAKVKLAEDMISRGSLTSSLSHLLQNYLNIPQDYMNNTTNHIVPPILSIHGDDTSLHNEILESTTGLANAEAFNADAINRVPDVWNWEYHVGPLS